MKHYLQKIAGLLALLSLSLSLAAQSGDVKGTVKDSNGNPLSGVVVYYQDTNVSTVTDGKGAYSVKAMPGKVLVVSMLGMKEQKIQISGPRTLDIELQDDSETLDDVVVVGYGTQKREDLTGSIASVGADEIRKSQSVNLMGSLQGRVAGLSISSQSGEPGAGYQIRIRGANSINASSEPLYVIDGVQLDLNSSSQAESDLNTAGTDPLSFLNPSDIQSIEVLKDASASAIYGARGANGVILITTKSGVENGGKTAVTVDASLGFAQAARRLEMLNGQEWINYRWERADYGGKTSFDDGEGHPMDVSDREWFNWQDLMYRTAVSTNLGVSVRSQINKNTQLLMSLGRLGQEGIVRGNEIQRLTGMAKIDHSINKKVKVGMSLNFSQNNGDGAMTSTGGSFTTNGLIQLIYRERPISMMTSNDDEYFSIAGFTSLLDLVNGETFSKKKNHRMLGNAYFRWTIVDGLTFNAQASCSVSNSNIKEYYSKKSRWGRQDEGLGRYALTEQTNYNVSARLNYRKNFNKAHLLEAMAGVEMGEQSYDYLRNTAKGFTDESSGAFDLAKGKTQMAPTQNYYDLGRMSAFGRVNYNYKSRYYATFNFRADGSSRFSEGRRVGYFPSASLGWKVSKEPFMRGQRWLDNLMVRVSAGSSGNDRIPMYSNLARMDMNYASVAGVEYMGMSSVSSSYPELKWETTYQYDAGIDLSILKRRINLTADVFYKDTRDMLYKATLASQSGFAQAYRNLGRVDNKGIEISLNTRNIDKHGFLWTSTIAFDMLRNKVRNIGEGIEYTADSSKGNFNTEYTRIIVGQPIGVAYGYVADGNYQLDDFIITSKSSGDVLTDYSILNQDNWDQYKYDLKEGVVGINGRTPLPGDRKYKNFTGDDNTVNDLDRQVISNPYPKFSASLGNTFSWKGLSLYVFLDGAYGREILNEFKMRSEAGRGAATYQYNVTKASYEGAWRFDNPSNTYSRLLNDTNDWCSSYYVEDASFIRLKTLSLSYALPAKICKKIHFQGLKFSVTFDNLHVWTNYSGLDPDISSNKALFPAYDTMTYPKAKTCTFGITANL